MPIIKTSKGFHIPNTKTYHQTYQKALQQLRAIQISKRRR
jgi:hypothetical protein